MAIVNSYVKLPEATLAVLFQASRRKLHRPGPALQGLRWPWFRWPEMEERDHRGKNHCQWGYNMMKQRTMWGPQTIAKLVYNSNNYGL